MSTAAKTINNVFSAWKASCEKTKKDQMTMFRKIEKYAAKLNSKEQSRFLEEAALFNEQYELKLSTPYVKLDELLAHYDQMEWDAKNKKKLAQKSKVRLNLWFFCLIFFPGRKAKSKKEESKNHRK